MLKELFGDNITEKFFLFIYTLIIQKQIIKFEKSTNRVKKIIKESVK